MEIDKKDLKIISRDFRVRANAVFKAGHLQFNARIAMLVNYINAQPVIKAYLDSIYVDYDPTDDLNEIRSSYGSKAYIFPSDVQQATSEIYQILLYISKNQNYPTYIIGRCYSNADKYDDLVGCVYAELIDFMVQEIDRYLINIATKMGFDEDSKYQITVNGPNAQVIIANDNSNVDAVQNNGLKSNEVSSILEEIINIIDSEIQDKELAKSMREQIELVKNETNQQNPKKEYIKTALNGIRTLSKGTGGVIILVEKINKLAQLLGLI